MLLMLFSTMVMAQGNIREMDVDLASFCKDPDEKSLEVCNAITQQKIDPIELNKKGEDGSQWKIRFSFGFTRTDYRPTDLKIDSTPLKVVVKDVEMHERTSGDHYDPRTWEHLQDAARWIDEPTNTFTFSIEKNKNIIYITVFHPKFLKSLTYHKTDTGYEFNEVPEETTDFSSPIPEGSSLMYLGNTHRNMNWQIGYGRQFVIFENKKAGKLTYTIKGDVGISTGQARSVQIVPGEKWDDYQDDHKIQGYNYSLGQRLEYQRGKVSLFIDQKMMRSNLKHGFYDGTIEYNLNYNPITFGVGIDLFTKKKKK